MTVEQGRIVVTPSERIRGKYQLVDLVTRIPEEYTPSEEGWGPPVGSEVL